MKSKSTIIVIVFVIGSLVGGAFTSIFLCHCADKMVAYPPAYEKLSIAKANGYFKNYFSSPLSVKDMKGFMVSRDCFQKMKDLDEAIHGNSDGYRLYFGNDGRIDVVMIVPTINGYDQAKNNLIFSLNRKGTSPCPNVCDEESPIAKQ